MLKVEHISVWGFEHAIRGMRNPMNSWDKSDSHECPADYTECHGCTLAAYCNLSANMYIVGLNDLDLMRRLYKAGPEHRKCLRQIFVSMDITAPLYWWKEFDTYKVGTVANSCSTMHKIHAKKFELDDFSNEYLIHFESSTDKKGIPQIMEGTDCVITPLGILRDTIRMLNVCRAAYLKTKDKKYWWQMIQLLPSSYNQKRTVTMNYENVVSIIKQRSNHKLDEWHILIDYLESLPYVKEIMEEK